MGLGGLGVLSFLKIKIKIRVKIKINKKLVLLSGSRGARNGQAKTRKKKKKKRGEQSKSWLLLPLDFRDFGHPAGSETKAARESSTRGRGGNETMEQQRATRQDGNKTTRFALGKEKSLSRPRPLGVGGRPALKASTQQPKAAERGGVGRGRGEGCEGARGGEGVWGGEGTEGVEGTAGIGFWVWAGAGEGCSLARSCQLGVGCRNPSASTNHHAARARSRAGMLDCPRVRRVDDNMRKRTRTTFLLLQPISIDGFAVETLGEKEHVMRPPSVLWSLNQTSFDACLFGPAFFLLFFFTSFFPPFSLSFPPLSLFKGPTCV